MDNENPSSPQPDPRRDLLLQDLSHDMKFVEIGASFRPLVPKRDGWKTCNVDHSTREGLLEKYSDATIDAAQVESVDVVWTDGLLHKAFPSRQLGTFDALVASHVIEHMPDLVSFLDSARQLLHPDGALVFALPDKRWCYDFFRPVSLAGDALLAHHQRRTDHTAAVLFNEVAYSMTLDKRPGWAAGERADALAFFHELSTARHIFDAVAANDGVYRDAHAWQFTPTSFELMILDLSLVGAIDWRVEWIKPTGAGEFLGRLRPGVPRFDSLEAQQIRRRDLLWGIAEETRVQLQSILSDRPDDPAYSSMESDTR